MQPRAVMETLLSRGKRRRNALGKAAVRTVQVLKLLAEKRNFEHGKPPPLAYV
jgi:hypothetical protein